jgi:hypothetical protein
MKAEAIIEGGDRTKTAQVVFIHHVQKSYRAFQVETSQQNAHAISTGKPDNFGL